MEVEKDPKLLCMWTVQVVGFLGGIVCRFPVSWRLSVMTRAVRVVTNAEFSDQRKGDALILKLGEKNVIVFLMWPVDHATPSSE